ncbi:ABC transporter transmembrane domain-containing protein [Desulfosporosinus sp. SB140]|uniref:ABC transporter transmembrane domain-containing protein n=1 Tax=Desulfosporosinus paludis TaxID=3115649 RepID=UPI00388DBB6C
MSHERLAVETTSYNPKKTGDWRSFINLLRQTKPPKLLLSIAILMSVATTCAGLVVPLFTKNLVDSFSLNSLNRTQIVTLVIVFITQAIAGGLSIYLLNYAGQNVVASLRDRLWKKLLILPVSYYDNSLTGETISRMTNDTGVLCLYLHPRESFSLIFLL